MNKKFLQVTISLLLVAKVIILGIFIANKLVHKRYLYVDMNGSTGASEKCYYDKELRSIWCIAPIRVQQYTEE